MAITKYHLEGLSMNPFRFWGNIIESKMLSQPKILSTEVIEKGNISTIEQVLNQNVKHITSNPLIA